MVRTLKVAGGVALAVSTGGTSVYVQAGVGLVAADQIASGIMGTESQVSQAGTALCDGNQKCGEGLELVVTMAASVPGMLKSLSNFPIAKSTAPVAPPQMSLLGTGTRQQFRSDVLRVIQSDPEHPLRFLLDETGAAFKRPLTRRHSDLIDNPDVWEAGHIMSNKLGGERLMVQTAWENQTPNLTIERFGGFGVLDNPVIDIGGIPVSRSSAIWWEQEGFLPIGTVRF